MLNSLHSLAHCVQIRHFLREGLSPDPVPTIVCDTPAGGTAMAEGEVLLTQPGDALEDTNSENSDSDANVTSKCIVNSVIIFYQSTQIVNSQ